MNTAELEKTENAESTAPVKENKMGVLPVGKLVFSMSLPMMVSMLVQALYNIVDSLFVSQINQNAFTGVSLAFPLQNLMIAVGVGTGVGVNANLARALGEKKFEKANKFARHGIFLAVCSYLAFLAVTLCFTKVYFRAQTDVAATIRYGEQYLYIAGGLSVGSFMQIMNERLLQSTGKTVLSMFTQGLGAVINIVLDPILIFKLGMGVRGAALATIVSQGVSCLWVVLFLFSKKSVLKLRVQNFLQSPRLILPCVGLGTATFIMQASESVLSVCFNSSLARYGGDIAVGAMTILTSVMQFALLPLQGISQGAQPILSYNYGAKNVERVRKTFRVLLTVCLTYSALIWAFVMLCPRVFAGIFTPDAELIEFTGRALRIYCAVLAIFGIQQACQITFVSIGKAVCSIIVAVMRKFVLLIPLIYLMPHLVPDPTLGVYLAEPVADTLAVTFTSILFSHQFRKALRTLESERSA